MSTEETEPGCISEVAKAQIHSILNSWLYKKIGQLERLKKDKTVDKAYLKAFETRLAAVKETQDKLLDMPTCKHIFKLGDD